MMKREFVPALMAAFFFVVLGNLDTAQAGDAGDGPFSKLVPLSLDTLDETRGLGGGTSTLNASVQSDSTGGDGPGGAISIGDSTFGNFAGMNNNAFATAPGATAVAQMTVIVNFTGGAN